MCQVRKFLSTCAQDGGTPLWRACFHGKDSIVQLLIECGADVNLPTDVSTAILFVSPFITIPGRGVMMTTVYAMTATIIFSLHDCWLL